MADNIVFLRDYTKDKPKANVVEQLLSSIVSNYNSILGTYNINVEDPHIAFDVATIQFLLRGMAHRSQGEEHPSQIVLNSMRANLMGN